MKADVAIVGGGLVGASLAVALSRTRFEVALIEAAPPPSGAPSWDERCIAINAASRQIFESIGVWNEIAPIAEPIRWTHISERGKFGVARFTAEEAGLPALGYNVPVRALGQVLWRAVGETGASLFSPASVDALERSEDGIGLQIATKASRGEPASRKSASSGFGNVDGASHRLTASLVIAADGAQSSIRRLLDLPARTRDYQQSAIVTAVRTSRPHRGCAYERFTPDGPIALLPKPEGCSLVWTVPSVRVDAMLAWSDEEFLRQAQETFGERLGTFVALGQRATFPLTQVVNEQLVAPRVLFAGNAAQSLHPVAAQGFNLGLRDVAAIAALLADAADPGATDLLARYERSRAGERSRVADFTDGIVRLFSNRLPGLSALRHLGLLALDLAPPVKRTVMWQNLGYGALPPALHRGS